MTSKKDHSKANLMHVTWKYLQSTHFDCLIMSLILVSDWAGKICKGVDNNENIIHQLGIKLTDLWHSVM